MPLKSPAELNNIRTEILSAIKLKFDWTKETQPDIPKLPYNVWRYIDYGSYYSDGNPEKAIGTVTIKYDGTIEFGHHL